MFKKSSIFICFLLATLLFVSLTASAQQPIRVLLDGEVLQFDVQPTTIDGRTMVPMRVIFEALGAEIEWNERTGAILAIRDDFFVRTVVGSRYIEVSGIGTRMDVAPITIDGRTLVPLRFVSEAFGADVYWDSNMRVIYITSPFNDWFEPGWDDSWLAEFDDLFED